MAKSLYNVDLYHIASGWLLQAGIKVEAETEAEAVKLASKVIPYETALRSAVTKLADLSEPADDDDRASEPSYAKPVEPVEEAVADLRTDAEKAADDFVASLTEDQKSLFEARLNSALKR